MTESFLEPSFELARYYDNGRKQSVSIKQYQDLIAAKDQVAIANMIYHRLHSRYLKPHVYDDKTFKSEYKNGFSIMANCCLLIETLHSFQNGWVDSHARSGRAFREFFATDRNFKELETKGDEMFVNVRCGILHQGETTNGWKIDRNNKRLVDGKTIHAVAFLKRLEKSLTEYREALISQKWDSKVWKNLRRKMDRIILNCGTVTK